MAELIRASRVVGDLPDVADRLLAAIPYRVRKNAEELLRNPRNGGRGLRSWVLLLEAEWRPLPRQLPLDLVEVYLTDNDAEPFHDCEKCGLMVPVRVAKRTGHEPTVEREYFPNCPNCGCRTGRFAFWSARA